MAIVVNGEELSGSALLVLLLATCTTLSSGTNYVVGSYAPQYADKVKLEPVAEWLANAKVADPFLIKAAFVKHADLACRSGRKCS